jgi:hypothetical protein
LVSVWVLGSVLVLERLVIVTTEVYKSDKRFACGERLVCKIDHEAADLSAARAVADAEWPAERGYRCETHETYVTRRNAMTGVEYSERYDTPYYLSPSSETYWSS